jgi:hypothetical protein
MPKTVARTREPAEVQDHNLPSREEIRLQLRSILASPAFHGSKRCQQFLEYVCEKSLAGEGGSLKERTVAVEVFGRRPQADLGEDTIVRVGAREVRKRLALYYEVTSPIISWYRDRGILVSVDAMRSAQQVGREILAALEAMRPFLDQVPALARRSVDLTGLGDAFGATDPTAGTSG